MNKKINDLVFLPGWGFHASIFEILTPHLDSHRLHFTELPKLDELDDEKMVSFIERLPTQSTLVGWSLGGLFAIRLCSAYPEKFNHLVLLASTPKFVADQNHRGISSQTANDFLLRASEDATALSTHFNKLACMPSHTIRAHLKAHSINNPGLTLSQLKYLIASDFRDEYASLRLPILSIVGEKDVIVPTLDKNNISIPGAGHAFPFTHEKEVCQYILNFAGKPQ